MRPAVLKVFLVSLMVLSVLFLAACSSGNELTGGTTVNPEGISTLTVVVKTEQGELLPEAEVYVNGRLAGKTSKYGASKGTQTVILEGPENHLRVWKEGYESSLPIEVSASSAGEQQVTIILETKKTNVVVYVETGGKAVEGARVSLFRNRESTPSYVQFTDDYGDAQFAEIPDNEYTVTVAKEGYELFRLPQSINVASGGEYRSVDVELQPLAEFLVQVVDTQGKPLPHAEVTLYTKNAYHSPGEAVPIATEYADRNGRVHFTAVEFGEVYVVLVKKEDYLAQAQEQRLKPEDHSLRVELVWNVD